MKKNTLLILLAVTLSSCGGKEQCKAHLDMDPYDHLCDRCGKVVSEHLDEDEDGLCDICYGNMDEIGDISFDGCDDEDIICKGQKYASAAKPDPSYPFYLKVGETRKVDANKNTSSEEQKHFYWDNKDSEYVSLTFDESVENNPKKAYFTGQRATGSAIDFAQVVATNTFTPALVSTFSIKVVDYDEELNYLWQYDSEDRKQFGYVYEVGKKQGTAEGIANLAGRDWGYVRSAANALNSSTGGLAFGKNDLPESFSLTTKNTRKVKSITIEHGSARGQATMSLSIGDNLVKSVNSPKAKNSMLKYDKINCNGLAGDIKIQFDTPELDYSRIDDSTYLRPGATYIKSIFIEFWDEDISKIEVSPNSGEDRVFISWNDFSAENLRVDAYIETGKREIPTSKIIVSQPDFECASMTQDIIVSYEHNGQTYQTSYPIYLANSLVIDEVHNEPDVKDYVQYGTFNPKGLVVRAVNSEETYSSVVTSKVKWCDPNSFNADKATSSDTFIRLGSTSVYGYIEKEPYLEPVEVQINDVQPINRIEMKKNPTNMSYLSGSKFSIAGLDLYGYAEDETLTPASLEKVFKWYDGESYLANATDETAWSEELMDGTTSVVGICEDLEPYFIENICVLTPTRIEIIDGTPDTTKYEDGQNFKYGGLRFAIYGEDDTVAPTEVTGNKFNWYDGTSYDTEPQVKTNVLSAGTTYVIGELKGFEDLTVKIEGITVGGDILGGEGGGEGGNNTEPVISKLNLIKSESDLEDGAKYLVIGKDADYLRYVDGSYATSVIDHLGTLEIDSISDTMEVQNINGALFTLNNSENGTYQLKGEAGAFIGCTNKGAISITKTAAHKDFVFNIDENYQVKFQYKLEDQSQYFFGYNTGTHKFNMTKNGSGNVYLFKLEVNIQE